jgi:hypothetical protein
MINKKTFLFGILFWIIIFAEVSIIGFTPGLATMKPNGFELNLYGQLIHFVVVLMIAFYFARAYFSGKPISFADGLKFGITILIIGTILDMVITVPLFVKSYPAYYSDILLWIGYALSLIGFGFGAMFKKN